MEQKRKHKKRLSVDLNIKLHCELKKIAAMKNLSITDYVKEALLEAMNSDRQLGFK